MKLDRPTQRHRNNTEPCHFLRSIGAFGGTGAKPLDNCTPELLNDDPASEIDRTHFEELIHSHPVLGLAMTRLMIVRRRELENKVEALVFRDVSSKLAELLVKLAGENGVDDARGTLIALKITHQELANLIGSTRETVSLTLSTFKRKRLIQTEGRKVIISDAEALRALY